VNTSNKIYLYLIYLFLTGLLFYKLPFSRDILSGAQILMVIFWIYEGNFNKKLKLLIENKATLAFLLIYFLHIFGLIYTTDFQYAFKDLRIKLPLLVIPVIFSTITPFSKKQVNNVLSFFTILVLATSIYSLILYFINPNIVHRSITPLMSHIRFSLLTCFSIAIVGYYIYSHNYKNKYHLLALLIFLIWLLIFHIFILGSINGIVILLVLLFFWMFCLIFTQLKIKYKLSVFFIILSIIGINYYVFYSVNKEFFPVVEEYNFSEFEKYSKAGSEYTHRTWSSYENGMLIHIYIAEEEVKKEWNKKSKIDFDSTTANGGNLEGVLYRYLTSLKLSKDSVGISSLSTQDMLNIERGITNYKLAGKNPLVSRLYEFLWGYYDKKHSNDPNYHSFFERKEFWKASLGIIKSNIFFGVGTGDMKIAFIKQYDKMNSELVKERRLRSHNQYLAITVSFGVFGLLIFLIALLYPPYIKKTFNSFLFITFLIIVMTSMISEDTLETQVGVSIFTFFYCFFVFLNPNQSTQKRNENNF